MFIQRVNKSENKWSLKKPRNFFFLITFQTIEHYSVNI